uniref:Cytochrome cd1 nitrite reductase n=1 Tax=Bursaphelenchus xylophilus TaxID=6326 RepID=A0A1I7SNF3_BURXY
TGQRRDAVDAREPVISGVRTIHDLGLVPGRLGLQRAAAAARELHGGGEWRVAGRHHSPLRAALQPEHLLGAAERQLVPDDRAVREGAVQEERIHHRVRGPGQCGKDSIFFL